ncbi:MAG: LytTR family transcriptional regulator DNA-binding domain-containing protein [Prevotellaceae bacterium]|jgi:two-component system LytT family response regulator|nr:LytTR family transcriptional regulator DNA-binding domain-containing protein [Prevotellaceae bacterium]
MTVLIIDDEAPARDIIRHYLKSYPEVEVVGEASNGFDAMKAIGEKSPQLIFLDVQMPKLTGLEMLELMKNPPLVIFSTAYDQFAIQAFEQNAIDYLLKPYSMQRFDAALQKALARVKSGESLPERFPALNAAAPGALTRVAVKDRQQIHVIPLHSIGYVEAYGDYVKLHTDKGIFLKEKTMKYFEENFPQQQFIRVHRSFIVNVDMVAKIELYEKESYRVHLKSGEILKASSSGYKALKEAVRW